MSTQQYKAGDTVRVDFLARDSDGITTAADATPTGALFLNGASNANAVTVTQVSGGLYTATFTAPGAAGNVVTLKLASTVGGLTNEDAATWRLIAQDVTVAKVAATIAAGDLANGAITNSTFASGAIDATAFAQGAADKVWSTTSRTITGGTITTYTGNTPQTGDSFVRIGANGAGLTGIPYTGPTAAQIWQLADGIETSITPQGALRAILAAAAGKAAGLSGTSVTFRNQADTKTRISATVDADGNRTSVTLDLT